MREKSDSQYFILKFNQIVTLNVLPESNPKPEVQNPKPEMMGYEKPDPTRYPNAQTRPDPKPEKSLPAHALLFSFGVENFFLMSLEINELLGHFWQLAICPASGKRVQPHFGGKKQTKCIQSKKGCSCYQVISKTHHQRPTLNLKIRH